MSSPMERSCLETKGRLKLGGREGSFMSGNLMPIGENLINAKWKFYAVRSRNFTVCDESFVLKPRSPTNPVNSGKITVPIALDTEKKIVVKQKVVVTRWYSIKNCLSGRAKVFVATGTHARELYKESIFCVVKIIGYSLWWRKNSVCIEQFLWMTVLFLYSFA